MAITKIQSESLNLADTYDFTGTVTGAGGQGTNFFSARNQSTALTVNHGALTLIPYDTEVSDVDGVFTNTASNYKFTCQTTGWHYFNASIHWDNTLKQQIATLFFVNGSVVPQGGFYKDRYGSNVFRNGSLPTSLIYYLNASDTVQVYGYQTQTGSGSCPIAYGSDKYTWFMGYRIAQ